jgi:nucleotide-binding universal stress UspA family protein
MFQRFFVPLDGSARAEKAILVAARMARETAGLMTLARVIAPASSVDEYGADALVDNRPLLQARVAIDARAYLDEVLARYKQELDGFHLVLETAPGTLPSTLLKLSDQEYSDLIVMCSRGEHWIKRWVFGSVTQATFRHSHVPVLVLNERQRDLALDVRPLRILVPLDGSELSEAVLPSLFQLLSTVSPSLSHRIHLFQVISIPPASGRFRISAHLSDTLQQEEVVSAQRSLLALARRLSDSNPVAQQCMITTSVVIGQDVAEAILKQAEPAKHGENEAPTYDLIALATHGRTGFKRAMLGSIAEHVFGATSLPLLLVAPPMGRSVEEQASEPAPRWVGLL